MAVLTRPLFHAQERIDLEDFNQLLSGLRTDSKLWTRQVLGDKNYILKGFNASGLNTTQLTIDILDGTMLFSGKQDPDGTSSITISNNTLITAASTPTISFTRDDGSSINFIKLASGATPDPALGQWQVGADAAATLVSIRAAIVGLASAEFPSANIPTPTGTSLSLTTATQGFINITIDANAGFQRLSDTVLNNFDYTGDLVESPSDLSYWTIHADATSTETKLTQEITSQFRATGTDAVRTLFIYAQLLTEEATPITKAFWDPSANSGSGAEFNQRVNTAVDLSISLNVQDSILTGNDLFANSEICRIEVDQAGQILSIRDTRDLYFEGVDSYDWNRTSFFATLTTLTTVPTNVTVTSNLINSTEFQVEETISFFPINATLPTPGSSSGIANVPEGTPVATSKIDAVTTGAIPVMGIEKFDLSLISTYGFVVFGTQSGACRLVETINSNFVRDDKDLGSLKEWIDAVTTGIRQAKGTDNWFDDVDGNVQDALSFINSAILPDDDLSVYQWNPASGGGGALTITTDPAALVEFTVVQTPTAGNTILIGTTTFTAVAQSATPVANQFRIGTSAATAATNIAQAIDDNANFVGTVSGTSVTASTSSRDNFLNASNVYTVTFTPASGTFTATRELGVTLTNDLLALRVFEKSAKLFIERADASTGAASTAISIPAGNVLYLTLPLETDFDSNGGGAGLRYRSVTDFTTARALANYNSTNPIFGELNNPNTANSFIGTLKTIPIGDFVNDGRNYWIAVCEDTASNTDLSILHIRGVGAVNGNESIPVGEGVTNQTLTYIGASNASDSTPSYPSVTAIAAHSTDGAYEVTSAFNATTITQSEDLTNAISDLNNHLVTLKNVEYQDKGVKLISGGFWTWVASTSTLTMSTFLSAFIQIPGLANNTNTILPASFNTSSIGTGLADGQVITATINRVDTGTAQNVTLAREDIDAVVPGRDKFIIARRVGTDISLGIPASMTLTDGDSSKLDGALGFLGLSGGSAQLPRQLKTAFPGGSATAGRTLLVENADVSFTLGGFSPNDTDTSDDDVILTIPVGTGVLQWEGGSFIFPTTGTAGTVNSIFHTSATPTNDTFRERTDPTTFTLPTIANGSSVWCGISISAAALIVSGDVDATYLQAYLNAQIANIDWPTFYGRLKGEPSVTFGSVQPAANVNDLTFAEFGGDVPIAQVLLTRDSSGNLEVFTSNDIVVVGAAGGGGGSGTGDANQDLNNYLNRLNLAPFNYLSPLIAATADFNADINSTDTTAGAASTGISFNTTTQLALVLGDQIDNDFKQGNRGLSTVELMAHWTFDSDTNLPQIDPSAKWYVTQDPSNTTVDPTFLNTHEVGQPVDLVLAIPTIDATNNTFTSPTHGLSNGQRVTLTLPTTVTLTSAIHFVRVIDTDVFAVYSTVPNADADTSRTSITITGTYDGTGTATLAAGILDRVDNSEVVIGDYTFDNPARFGTVLINNAAASGTITITFSDATSVGFTLSGSGTGNIATALAASINAVAGATRRVSASVSASTVTIFTESAHPDTAITFSGTASQITITQFAVTPLNQVLFVRVTSDTSASGITDRILGSLALFYAYDEGLFGITSGSVDGILDILRDNNLVNSSFAGGGFGRAGRGIVLLNNASTPVNTEIALDANNNITVGGTAPIQTNGATEGQGLVANADGVFVPGSASAGGGLQVAEQTGAGSFTWTCPSDVSEITLTMSGGAGGGGGGAANNSSGAGSISGGGGGGGAGFIFEQTVDGLVANEVYTIVVGAAGGAGGGASQNGSGSAGGSGGTSSISGTLFGTASTTLTTTGGGGGGGGVQNGSGGAGGSAGTVSGLIFFGSLVPTVTGGVAGAAGATSGGTGGSVTTQPYVLTLGNTGLASGGGVDNGGVAAGGGGAGAGMNGAGNGGVGHNGSDHGGGGGGGGGGFTAGTVGGTGNDNAGGTGGTAGLGVMRITYVSTSTADIV